MLLRFFFINYMESRELEFEVFEEVASRDQIVVIHVRACGVPLVVTLWYLVG